MSEFFRVEFSTPILPRFQANTLDELDKNNQIYLVNRLVEQRTCLQQIRVFAFYCYFD